MSLQRALTYLVGNFADVYTVARDYAEKIRFHGRTIVVDVNTGHSGTPGYHWCIIITYKVGPHIISEFYDSFGYDHTHYNISYAYPITRYNNIQHQLLGTNSCGMLCIYFVYLRFLKRCVTRRVYRLGKNKYKNERAANSFYRKLKSRMTGDPSPNFKCRYFGCYPKEAQNFH